MKIAIDAGHGLYTPGKRCLKSIDPKQTREWVLNSRIANYLTEYLKDYDCEIKRVDDVTGEKDIALSERCRRANNWNADFYLSIHHNAGVNGGAGGGVVIYTYRGTSAETHQKRDIIYDEVIKANGLRGNRYDGTLTSGFYVLVNTDMPAVLIECGFMDSTVDTPKILTEDFAKKTALGLRNGLVKSLGLTKVKKEEKEEPMEDDMTKQEVKDIVYEVLAEYIGKLALKQPAEWSKEAREWAKKSEIVKGTNVGDEWKSYVDREQLVTIVYRLMQEIDPIK